MTKILPHNCKGPLSEKPGHDYQDEKYGKNRRVMNVMKSGKKYRCTVCGQTVDETSSPKNHES